MGKVKLAVGGHNYRLSCRDGDEAGIERAGQYLDEKARELTGALGAISENQLLLMAGLQICGELFALRDGGPVPPAEATTETDWSGPLQSLLERAEKLRLELVKAAERS